MIFRTPKITTASDDIRHSICSILGAQLNVSIRFRLRRLEAVAEGEAAQLAERNESRAGRNLRIPRRRFEPKGRRHEIGNLAY